MAFFEDDPETKAVIMIGEIGGPQETEAAKSAGSRWYPPVAVVGTNPLEWVSPYSVEQAIAEGQTQGPLTADHRLPGLCRARRL